MEMVILLTNGLTGKANFVYASRECDQPEGTGKEVKVSLLGALTSHLLLLQYQSFK